MEMAVWRWLSGHGSRRPFGDGCLDMADWSFHTKPGCFPLLRMEHDESEESVARIHAGDDRVRAKRALLAPGDLLKNYLTTCNRKQRESSELWKLPSGECRQEMAAYRWLSGGDCLQMAVWRWPSGDCRLEIDVWRSWPSGVVVCLRVAFARWCKATNGHIYKSGVFR